MPVSLGTYRSSLFFTTIILLLLSLLMTTPTSASPPSPTRARVAELEHLAQGMAHRLRRVHAKQQQQQQQHHSSPSSSPPSSPPPPAPRCVFSDLDGTLLHFGGDLLKQGYEILSFDSTSAAAEAGEGGGHDGDDDEDDACMDEATAAAAVPTGKQPGGAPSSSFFSLSSSSSSSTPTFSSCLSAPTHHPSSSSSTSAPRSSLPLTPPIVHRPDPSHPLPRYVTLRYKPDGSTRACIELPSLTSGPGYISLRTLRLVQAIRAQGCLVVLITGARSSTYLMRRRTGLPVVDYECIEGGGRLLHDPHAALDFATVHHEEDHPAWDLGWKEGVGPLEKLWALYEEMKESGWRVDGRDYYTNFRVDTGGKPWEEWEAVKAR
jgi:hypothetical protein